MLILAKATMAMMIGFILAIILGLILIPILRKFHIGQSVSIYLQEKHKKKNGIPTMGGLIFIIPTVVVMIFMIIFNKIKITTSLLIVLITFLFYALIGFIDDFLIIKRNNNAGLSESLKFILQVIVAIIFFLFWGFGGNRGCNNTCGRYN